MLPKTKEKHSVGHYLGRVEVVVEEEIGTVSF